MKGLYIHIPFCVKKCHYCDFVITLKGPSTKRGRFLDALETDMSRRSAEFGAGPWGTLYIGGGTPSTLEVEETRRLFDRVEKNFKFTAGAERTLEANPGDITPERAELYRGAGINRISLGAQTFRDRTLQDINRDHGAAQIESSYRMFREAGFANISFDLILSLPGETADDARYSLERALDLGPEHVSLYELTVEEGTVFGALQKKGKLRLPGEDESLRMLEEAKDLLQVKGYCHYELLSYAKPGFESKHNMLYWANEETLGLGPGAVSYLGGRRFKHSASYEEYLQKIEAGDWSSLEEERLSPERKETESFVLALRLIGGAKADRFTDLLPKIDEPLKRLTDRGLLIRDDGRIRLTGRGQLFAETVFAELMLK